MTLKQPNSANFWEEGKGSGAALDLARCHWIADAYGGYSLELESVGSPTASRVLADAHSGYGLTGSAGNPSSLTELFFISYGPFVRTNL